MEFNYKKKNIEIEGTSKNGWIYKCIVNLKSFYESDLLNYIYKIRKFINLRGDTIIDVGANIGNHSIFFQSFVCNKLISIECNKKTIPTLKRNLKKNISNYLVLEKALGSENTIGEMIMPNNSIDNIGMTQVKIVKSVTKSSVEIKTSDSMLNSINEEYQNIGMIKIDVEEMELDVLKGAKNTLQKQRPHLFIEAKDKHEFKKAK